MLRWCYASLKSPASSRRVSGDNHESRHVSGDKIRRLAKGSHRAEQGGQSSAARNSSIRPSDAAAKLAGARSLTDDLATRIGSSIPAGNDVEVWTKAQLYEPRFALTGNVGSG